MRCIAYVYMYSQANGSIATAMQKIMLSAETSCELGDEMGSLFGGPSFLSLFSIIPDHWPTTSRLEARNALCSVCDVDDEGCETFVIWIGYA